jgi:hypothetical protein
MCGLYSSGPSRGPMAGSCEHGDETSGSIKGGEGIPWVAELLSASEGGL